MKGLETGKDKVKKICEVLRKETLEPAKLQAEEIIQEALLKAEEMLLEAQEKIEKMKDAATKNIEREKNVFHSSLNQACKQALESLRQNIEEKLLSQELARLLAKHTQDPKVLAELISVVVKAVEKEGIDVNLSAYIPSAVSARSVNELLASSVLQQLKEKSVLLGTMTGGIELKLHKNNITIDLTDQALKELVANYIRKDFRELVFGSKF